MEKDDQAGAKAAIQHFFELWAYAYQSGDVKPLKAVSASGCKFCAAAVKAALADAERGEHTVGSEISLDGATYLGTAYGNYQAFDITITQGAWQVISTSGEVTDEEPKPYVFDARIAVGLQGSAWLVRAVDIADEDER